MNLKQNFVNLGDFISSAAGSLAHKQVTSKLKMDQTPPHLQKIFAFEDLTTPPRTREVEMPVTQPTPPTEHVTPEAIGLATYIKRKRALELKWDEKREDWLTDHSADEDEGTIRTYHKAYKRARTIIASDGRKLKYTLAELLPMPDLDESTMMDIMFQHLNQRITGIIDKMDKELVLLDRVEERVTRLENAVAEEANTQ